MRRFADNFKPGSQGPPPDDAAAVTPPPGTDAAFVPIEALGPAPVRQRTAPLDLDAIRNRLAGQTGRRYWKSLEELAETDEFRTYLDREFAEAPRDMQPLSRREFLRVMGAGLALAGVSGCAYQPAERIVPYVINPEMAVPGRALYFASAFTRGGYAYGVLGESHLGRPVKLEGNPEHPASLGATDSFTQASLLDLYDPERARAVRHLGAASSWDAFAFEMQRVTREAQANQGAGLHLLVGAFTSPTLADQLRRFLQRYPAARVYRHEPAASGLDQSQPQPPQPLYGFHRARRILALDSDFLSDEPGSIRYARDFIDGRRVRENQHEMNRLYVLESTVTLTGAMADHRLPLRPSQLETVARIIAQRLGAGAPTPAAPPAVPETPETPAPEGVLPPEQPTPNGLQAPNGQAEPAPPAAAPGGSLQLPANVPSEWIDALVQDLQQHSGESLVVAGPYASPTVRALAQQINQAIGAFGQTVEFIEPVIDDLDARLGTLTQLVQAMNGGQVGTLIVLDGNPAYTAPADLDFRGAMERVPLRVHLGRYDDETGVLCHWQLPESHYLEAWSDARAFDGTATIVQPLIEPLFSTRSIHEVMGVLLGEGFRPGLDQVRAHWMEERGETPPPPGQQQPGQAQGRASSEFERFWHQALLTGVVPETRAETTGAPPVPGIPPAETGALAGLELVIRPDPTLWDGRFANNAWLQELPKPLSALTWDNAAYISPQTAADPEYRLRDNDMVDLSYRDRTLRVPVRIIPGHPDGVVTVTLGYGRERAGRLGTGTGFNLYALRTSDAPWGGPGLEMRRTGTRYNLVTTQNYFSLHGRPLARHGDLAAVEADPSHPAFAQEGVYGPVHGRDDDGWDLPSLIPPEWPSDKRPSGENLPPQRDPGHWEGTGYGGFEIPAWGMVIDLTACIGCNACTIACQAENNIPTVGKDQVARNRQMHWLRVDTYFEDQPENPLTLFQPVPCMHCEKAPCEPVCPVSATSHSAEGINEMTYNRCVGTRYCSNNCPYKVRRFNFLQYADQKSPTIQMMRNPDVTVRSRGVMEKCTYCIQRINQGRIQAEKEERRIRDGDIVSACQQVCPTQAIVFGDINDKDSHGGRGSLVRQLKREPLNYTMLTELNTRPRTSYMARVRNPNPQLAHLVPHTLQAPGADQH
jgi:MoCo/4Fe-4S cofactor protein with predicted Tat translocation signal